MLPTHALVSAETGRELLLTQQLLIDGTGGMIKLFTTHPASWLTAVSFIVTGQSATATAVLYAFLGFLAVVALYELLVNTVSNRAALVGAALLSSSPIAVLYSRMPYHDGISLLLTVCYIWALTKLWYNYSFTWLVLSIALVLLLALTTPAQIPLASVLVFVVWKKQYLATHQRLSALFATILFLMVVSAVAFFQPETTHTSFNISLLRQLFGTILLTQVLGVFLILFGALAALRLWQEKKLPVPYLLTIVSLSAVLIASVMSKAVFEAVLPSVAVLLSILGSGVVFARKAVQRRAVAVVLLLLVLQATYSIAASDFFTTDHLSLQHDPIGEQRVIANSIFQQSGTTETFITSTADIIAAEPSYTDGITFFFQKQGGEMSKEYNAAAKSYLVVPIDAQIPSGTFVLQEFLSKKVLILPPRVGGNS